MKVRKEISNFEYWDEFIQAIKELASGDSSDYYRMVLHHANMRHNMHTMAPIVQVHSGEIRPPIGTLRFLPWHRQYLIEFEKLLQSKDERLTIPYWDWTTNRKFPQQLENVRLDFTFRYRNRSDRVFAIRTKSMRRNKLDTDDLPTVTDLKGATNENSFTGFTIELEGAGIIDDNTGEFIQFERGSTGLHNKVHNSIGGIMGNLLFSPVDPVFWLHHGFCDKVWWGWQKEHPNENPKLKNDDNILDPWMDVTVDDICKVENLPYRYE